MELFGNRYACSNMTSGIGASLFLTPFSRHHHDCYLLEKPDCGLGTDTIRMLTNITITGLNLKKYQGYTVHSSTGFALTSNLLGHTFLSETQVMDAALTTTQVLNQDHIRGDFLK